MKVIRETTTGLSYCVIRTDNHASSFAHIANLVAAAKADFPALKDDAINVVVYGGNRRKGQMGIEFTPPSAVPDVYVEIPQLELTLN